MAHPHEAQLLDQLPPAAAGPMRELCRPAGEPGALTPTENDPERLRVAIAALGLSRARLPLECEDPVLRAALNAAIG